MFGWEFPPYASGGLGTACFGMTKGLNNNDVKVTFVMPKAPDDAKADFVKLIGASNIAGKIKFREISSFITPYTNSKQYEERVHEFKRSNNDDKGHSIYGKDLYNEVYKYSLKAGIIALEEEFDVIHAHDWLTYRAGIRAKQVSGKPLVVHIHATEFDRTGGNPNQVVYDIEREGLNAADKVIAVSNFTKNMVVRHYGVSADKIEVVHNAVDFNDNKFEDVKINKHDKVILFLGRITIQKGPDYFIDAARKVLEVEPNVKFIVAGSGDMEFRMIERAANYEIGDKVLFAGFLRGAEIDKAYQMADLYVMPSISEPFGITPLEAMRNNTPVLISNQSGVSEVISHCMKVDFWDVEEMANKMVAAVRYNDLNDELKRNGMREIKKFSWDKAAAKIIDVYKGVCHG